jgi:hypothetical protein
MITQTQLEDFSIHPRFRQAALRARRILHGAEDAIVDLLSDEPITRSTDRQRRVAGYMATILGHVRHARGNSNEGAWDQGRCDYLAWRASELVAMVDEWKRLDGEIDHKLEMKARQYADEGM